MENQVSKYMHVSKLDAGKRQLEFAIKHFLNYSDIVVIHSLASAAHEIFNDLAKKQGIESVIEGLKNRVRPEKKKELIDKLNEAKNFFKHADKDENGILKFIPAQTEYLLLDACNLYTSLTHENPALIFAYKAWFFCKHPDILEIEEQQEKYRELNKIMPHADRNQFLEAVPHLDKKLMS
jgi:hypothetical protein